jgi:hypothetical protein
VAGSSVRTAVLDNLWLISRRCRQPTRNALRTRVVSKCLLIQGRCPAEYLALLPSHGSCNYECRSGKLCAMDLQSDQKMGSISAHIRACTVVVHKAIPWLPLCTGCCSVPPWRRTLPSSRIRILVRVWTGMRPGCPGAVHSVTGVGR